MSVKIRLKVAGARKRPFFKMVVADSRAKRDGKFIVQVGSYDPNYEPAKVEINHAEVAEWIAKGAQPSETVADLIRRNPPVVSAN